jgi:ATP-binding protein involved in chromosome partitioning
MLPPENYGIKCMSVGFLKEEGRAIIWKGPLGHYFIGQMIDYVCERRIQFLLDNFFVNYLE